MKKYLFFDCEFATSKGGEEKICEFGYVLVDDRFNVIYKGNIVINPNIKPNEAISFCMGSSCFGFNKLCQPYWQVLLNASHYITDSAIG